MTICNYLSHRVESVRISRTWVYGEKYGMIYRKAQPLLFLEETDRVHFADDTTPYLAGNSRMFDWKA